jgi:hypothetical protein
MTLSKTSVPTVDLDDIERQLREIAIPRSSDVGLAELARIVGQNLGRALLSRERGSPASVQPKVRAVAGKRHVKDGSAQGSRGSVEQALDGGVVPLGALAPRALKKRSHLRSSALAFAVPVLLVTVGVGAAVVMRAGSMDELGSRAMAIVKADDAPVQEPQVAAGDQTASQWAIGAAGSPPGPDQPIDVVAALGPAPPEATVIPAAPTMPIVSANVSLSEPPQPAAVSSIFGTPHRVYTVAVNTDLTVVSKGEPEVAPLPPAKPKTLASTDTTTARAIRTTGSVSRLQRHRSSGGMGRPARPGDFGGLGDFTVPVGVDSLHDKSEPLQVYTHIAKGDAR